MIQFGDYDGDGEVELAVQRGDTTLQIWQWLQNRGQKLFQFVNFNRTCSENIFNLNSGIFRFELLNYR